MTKKIGIVTDSTADLEISWYQDNDVRMVPLEVRFGNDIYKDWLDIKPKEFYDKLKGITEIAKTSQPSIADFINAYNETASVCDEIISIHISSKLSGTISSATIAAAESPVPVTLIDSETASYALGLIVMELVKARDRGAGIKEMVELAERMKKESRLFFYVDTLKYLEMGGRLGKASAFVGSLLNIKVILKLADGEVAPAARFRGKGKIVPALVEMVTEYRGDNSPRLAFAYADDKSDLQQLRQAFTDAGFDLSKATEATIGAVIGTYTGPGAFAVVSY